MQQRPDDAEAHLRNRVDLEDREIDMPMTLINFLVQLRGPETNSS